MQKKNNAQMSDEDIRQALFEFQVPYPDENLIDITVDNLRPYVLSKRKRMAVHFENLRKLLKETAISINFMSLTYWIITVSLYVMGYFTVVLGFSPYHMILILSPLPVIIGMFEVFRSRNEKMVEIELTCKFSPQEMAISKILIVCCYNVILNLVLSILLFSQSTFIVFAKITLLWLVPMIIAGSVTLVTCSRFKGIYTIAISFSIWILSAVFLTEQANNIIQYCNSNLWVAVILACSGILLFVKEIAAFKNRYYFERRASIGIDD